jgi:signal transduction histidine kinase
MISSAPQPAPATRQCPDGRREEGRAADETRTCPLEPRLRRSGQIAHDLNNAVGTVLGYAHLLLEDIAKEDPSYAFVEQVIEGGNEARQLIAELLANARPDNRTTEHTGPTAAE